MNLHPVGTKLFHADDRQTGRHAKANSLFSKVYESA
jgi:hypothetical protein